MKKHSLLGRLTGLLEEAGVQVVAFAGEPSEGDEAVVERGRQRAQAEGCEVVLGLGGGRVLDQAKLMAALARSEGPLTEFLNGRPLPSSGLPCVAVPTTAGSGAEAAQRVELRIGAEGLKREVGSPALLPAAALIDPLLTLTLPPRNTAAAGLIALTHALESYLSRRASPTVEALAHYALGLIAANLPGAFRDGQDRTAREKMALGSHTAALAAANTGLGAAHALALALTNRFNLSHGAACALVLPAFVAHRAPAIPGRLVYIAEALGLQRGLKAAPEEAAKAVVEALRQLIRRLKVPQRLAQVGVPSDALPGLAAEAAAYGCLRRNPREAEEEDLLRILEAAY
jgi:alcohol dehydrogenase class IV